MIPTLIQRPDGSVCGVDRRRLSTIPMWLSNDSPNGLISVPALSCAGPYQISVSADGPVELTALSGNVYTGSQTAIVSPARVSFQIEDGANPRGLMNVPIHVSTLLGTGTYPYIFPENLFMDEGKFISAMFYNDSPDLTTVFRLAFKGRKQTTSRFDPSGIEKNKLDDDISYQTMPFFFGLDSGSVTLGASSSANATSIISMPQTHHFQLMTLGAVSTGIFSFNLLNGDTGESLFDAPQGSNGLAGTSATVTNANNMTLSPLIFGNNQFPYRLREPKFFAKGSNIIIRTKNETSESNQIFITLGGRLIADRMWR